MRRAVAAIVLALAVGLTPANPIQAASGAGSFFKVNPAGTWLKVDSSPPEGDQAGSPTSVSLASLGVKAGERIALRARGRYANRSDAPDSDAEMFAVFRSGSQIVSPGKSRPPQKRSQPTCLRKIKTDIPEDFGVPNGGWLTVQVPAGADNLAFSANDCYFVDNRDPNDDFGVDIAKR